MRTISFGGFDSSFIDSLKLAASEAALEVADPGKADIHLHLNPYLKSLPASPKSTVAVIAEPVIVRPDLYKERIFRSYLDCITISSERAQRLGINTVIDLPVHPPELYSSEAVRDRRICLVAGHKFSASKFSNYGLRRKLLKSDFSKRIDLYGPDWLDPIWLELRRRIFAARLQLSHLGDFSVSECLGDVGKVFTSYKGIMDSNFNLMSRYQLSLVIENQSDYVSEKVWISMARGAVPLYIGPSLKLVSPDLANSVFQVEPNLEAIRNIIDNASEEEINHKRQSGYNFLKGDWILKRNSKHIANRYIDYVKEMHV